MKKQFALDIREVIEREMSDDGLFQIGRKVTKEEGQQLIVCLLYTSPSPRDS